MPVYQLCPVEGDAQAIVLEKEPVTIGRAPENRLALQDHMLSRFHCVVEPIEDETGAGAGGYRVRDLGSRNGTKLNGKRIQDSVLSPGDILKVGSFAFVVETEQTLKEKQAEARADAGATEPGWMTDLKSMIDMIPPKGEGLDDPITLSTGRGKPSSVLEQNAEGARFARLALLAATKARATDIHAEPKGDSVQVRMRVDGQMVQILDLPNRVGDLFFGLVKTACEFQPTGREVVLDGHLSARIGHAHAARRVDYRISFTPSVHGQKLVIRILDTRDAPKNVSDLRLPPYMHERIKKYCSQDAGMLLVCGPTGSGKTTSLYSALREIDRDKRNVVTIEDPVEYQIEGVTQIPIDEGKGNTFGALLRSVLRQDPDVILVGEIRDEETARTAMQAAMTGHLVFSTVHAKDTISAVFRLLDLKVEPYLVANSLEIILAQRLLRLLCDNCKRAVPVTPSQATRMGRFLEGAREVHIATGCAQCLRTGYRGRRAIFELLDFSDELRDVVLTDPTIQAMKKVIETGLFNTLVQTGWQLVARGVTTMEEVDRVATAR